jgi:hypothetical protein
MVVRAIAALEHMRRSTSIQTLIEIQILETEPSQLPEEKVAEIEIAFYPALEADQMADLDSYVSSRRSSQQRGQKLHRLVMC